MSPRSASLYLFEQEMHQCVWNTPPGRRGLGEVGRVARLASPVSNSRRYPRAFQNIYGCVHVGVRRLLSRERGAQ